MIHEILRVGLLQCNCPIIGDESSREAVVIDPGDEVERVQAVLARHDLKTKYIIATHTHIDHVGGLERLQRATGATVLMHRDDLPLYQNMPAQAALVGVPTPTVMTAEDFVKNGDTLRWGPFSLEVLHTPGHTPGSLALHLPGEERRLFSGDTLFQGSIGRTDLWGGNYWQMMNSIRNILLPFP